MLVEQDISTVVFSLILDYSLIILRMHTLEHIEKSGLVLGLVALVLQHKVFLVEKKLKIFLLKV